ITLSRHATPPPQSDVTGMSRTLCTTPAMSPSRKIGLASVISQASLPGCAPLPTTYCAAISPQHSVRIDMLPLSPEPMRSSTGNSIESVEQPCCQNLHYAPPIYRKRLTGVFRHISEVRAEIPRPSWRGSAFWIALDVVPCKDTAM